MSAGVQVEQSRGQAYPGNPSKDEFENADDGGDNGVNGADENGDKHALETQRRAKGMGISQIIAPHSAGEGSRRTMMLIFAGS